MSNATATVTPVATAVAYVLGADVAAAVKVQAEALVGLDKDFDTGMQEVVQAVARIMGTTPSFDHWTAVQAQFVADYKTARGVEEETARGRWVKVAGAMKASFALEKPVKPTAAAEKKAEQRKGADAEAAALIQAAGASTPQAILALSTNADAPIPAPVVAALAKRAGEAAKEAGKAATEAAREETKQLRETIRKATADLSLAQLRQVRDLIASMQAPVPATTE